MKPDVGGARARGTWCVTGTRYLLRTLARGAKTAENDGKRQPNSAARTLFSRFIR